MDPETFNIWLLILLGLSALLMLIIVIYVIYMDQRDRKERLEEEMKYREPLLPPRSLKVPEETAAERRMKRYIKEGDEIDGEVYDLVPENPPEKVVVKKAPAKRTGSTTTKRAPAKRAPAKKIAPKTPTTQTAPVLPPMVPTQERDSDEGVTALHDNLSDDRQGSRPSDRDGV